MFTPLQTTTLPADCAARIRRAILSGDFAPGERLPPERTLAERFDVNRVTVRSALARVVATGLLTVRQGRGYTVRDYRTSGGPDLLGGIAELAKERGELSSIFRDLLRVRRHLAQAVLEHLAAEPLSELDALQTAIDDFATLALAGARPDALARADTSILAALLVATDSPVLQLCLNPVRSVLAELPALQAAMYRTPMENVAGWRALLVWLRDPDPAGLSMIAALLAARDEATLASL